MTNNYSNNSIRYSFLTPKSVTILFCILKSSILLYIIVLDTFCRIHFWRECKFKGRSVLYFTNKSCIFLLK